MPRLADLFAEDLTERLAPASGLARGLPRAAYLSPDVLELERTRWLSRSWLFVGLGHEISNPGDLTPVPNFRLFLARDEEGGVRAFHNVCRHRGHELVAGPKQGCRHIVCPYHGWRYGLTGALKSISSFTGRAGETPPDFDMADHGLRAVRCETWHDWVFVNLDGTAPPLADYLRPLTQQLAEFDLSSLKHFHSLEHGEVKANWKLVMENSLEPYHTPFVHARTGAGIPLEDHHMILEEGLLGCGIDVGGEPADTASGGGISVDSRFFVVPPLFVFVLYDRRIVIVHRNLPHGERPDRTWRSIHLYSLGPEPLGAAEIEDWKRLEYAIHVEEDGPVYESLQRNKLSPVTDDGGLLSPAWESAVQAFYRQWAAALDAA